MIIRKKQIFFHLLLVETNLAIEIPFNNELKIQDIFEKFLDE